MANDLNSSDIETSDQEEDGSRIGSRAIASIIQKSAIDRVESKKKLRKLRDAANAPSTAWHCNYGYELFKQFAEHTLHIGNRPNVTPTGDDVARFILHLHGPS